MIYHFWTITETIAKRNVFFNNNCSWGFWGTKKGTDFGSAMFILTLYNDLNDFPEWTMKETVDKELPLSNPSWNKNIKQAQRLEQTDEA